MICHAKVTAEQSQKRRKSLARAKQGFQVTIEKFIERWCEKRMETFTSKVRQALHQEVFQIVLFDMTIWSYIRVSWLKT